MLRLSTKQVSLRRAALSVLSRKPKEANFLLARSLSSVKDDDKEVDPKSPAAPVGFFEKHFGLGSNVASPEFTSRWSMVVPAFATHMAIGSPWAWSIMADAVTREQGFVASAAGDWTMMESAFPLSIVFLMMGLSASVVGKWQMKVGARKALAFSSVAFGGGCLAGAAGIHFHYLPLLYAGYGALAGTGLGLAYTPPVQTLMQWFPDKKGIASGLTIAGFGSGALVFTPAVQTLMQKFSTLPEYLGPAGDFTTKFQDGKLFAEVVSSSGSQLVEVVQAGAAEIAKLPSAYDMAEGLYVVGSGSTGAAQALAVMGAAYFSVIFASACTMKKPHESYVPDAMKAVATAGAASSGGGTVSSNNNTAASSALTVPDVSLEAAMRSPQFYLLGTSFFCLATGGMGLFSVAKPMMSEVFSSLVPELVTSAFAANFLLMLSAGNLGGRLGWAAVSDAFGRRNTFMLFTLGSIPLYLFLPNLVESVVSTGSALPVYGFCASTALAVSMMGGVYAILPAYEADLYGTKFVGAIHGRMLLFSSMAAMAGPYMLINLRSLAEKNAIADLLTKVSPEEFLQTFGAPIESASELLASKALSISKLLVLAPPGTLDPTPHLYDTTMYTLSGLMAVAVVAHGMVRPYKHSTPVPTDGGDAGVIDVKGVEVPAQAAAPALKDAEETTGDRRIK